MKFQGNADDTQKKLPTFLQFLREHQGEDIPSFNLVKKVFKPNKFPSVTFDTERFRLRIDESSNLYEEVLEALESLPEENACLAIWITSPEEKSFSLESVPNEECTWKELGSAGWELEVKPKKTTKTKTSASRKRAP